MTAKKKLIRNTIISIVAIAILGASYVFVLNWDVNKGENQKTKDVTYVVFENIENVSSVHIKNQSAEYDIVLAESSKGNITYSIPMLEGRKVNALQIENAFIALSQMMSSKKLSVNKDELSEFGLVSPTNSYTVNKKDGDSVTVLIGDEIPMNGEFYCMIQGGNEVYVINAYSAEAVWATPEDYISTAVFDFDSSMAVSRFSLLKNGHKIMTVCADENGGNNSENYISGVWEMTYPWPEKIDSEKFAGFIEKLRTAELVPCNRENTEVVFDFEIELLAENQTYKFVIGELAPEGGVYIKNGEELYVADAVLRDIVESVNPDDYVIKFVNLAYMDDVADITVRYGDAEYAMEPAAQEGKPYVICGMEVPEAEFKKVYQELVGILYIQHSDVKPDGKPYLTITYNYKNDESEIISFFKYDERSMLAVRPNGTTVTVFESEIKKIVDMFVE